MELRQAIVAMMNRKDELEEQNTYVVMYSPYQLLANPHAHTCTHTLTLRLEEDIEWPFCSNCLSLFFFLSWDFFFFSWLGGRKQFCCVFVFSNKPPETVIYTHNSCKKRTVEQSTVKFHSVVMAKWHTIMFTRLVINQNKYDSSATYYFDFYDKLWFVLEALK